MLGTQMPVDTVHVEFPPQFVLDVHPFVQFLPLPDAEVIPLRQVQVYVVEPG